jgi:hypothetical protein
MISILSTKALIVCAFVVVAAMLMGCEKVERSEEVPFEGATFGFEMRAKTTLETTLHLRRIYLKPSGSNDEKVLVGIGSIEMDNFPTDRTVLAYVDYTIIDTIARTMDKLPPTQESHTLYMNPEIFSKEDYERVVKFVQSCYRQPIDKNKIIQWLDADVIGLEEGHIYYTVYAIVYKKLSDFETEYHAAEGKDYVRIKVNNQVYVSYTEKDGLETGGSPFVLRGDTLFYPDYYERNRIDSILRFKSRGGDSFGARVKVLKVTIPR